MSGSVGESNTVVGRCKCGRRYRVHNARPDMRVKYRNCERVIRITHADLRGAEAPVALKPVQSEDAVVPEAIPLGDDDVRLATKGSRPGDTGRVLETDEDLARTVGGEAYASSRPIGAVEDKPESTTLAAMSRNTRWGRFLRDLLASLYVTGNTRNIVQLVTTGAACAVPLAVGTFLSAFFGFFVWPIVLLLTAVVFFYIVQFFWSTLTRTAAGDDEIPITETEWDLVSDGLVPLLWLLGISVVCFGPAAYLAWFAPDRPTRSLEIYTALIAGSFFWPVAVMSAALGQSIEFLRPDWLIRCIWGIGPVYLLAWMMVVGVPLACDFILTTLDLLEAVPLIGPIAYLLVFTVDSVYMGYVVFRTLGLLYRHFHHRFPWRF
jgi:hypothetical protein